MKTFKEACELSLDHEGENEYFECDITLKVDSKKFKAHEVSICNGDLLFFTDKGTLNYVVDDYGNGCYKVELFNVDLD